MLSAKIENDKQDKKKKNKLKSSRLVEQISDWEKDNDVWISQLLEWERNVVMIVI